MATRQSKPAGISGIEPSQMTVPSMDRPSIAFAWFLDQMSVEDRSLVGDEVDLVMVCNFCTGLVCDIEDGDTLRVLLNTALAHSC